MDASIYHTHICYSIIYIGNEAIPFLTHNIYKIGKYQLHPLVNGGKFYTNEFIRRIIMKFGMCTDLLKAPLVAKAGFDYIEGSLSAVALASDIAYEQMVNAVQASGLKAEALNGMLPGTFTLTGPSADLSAVEEYLATGFSRAAALGTQIVVFGSGRARNVPEGWEKEKALHQLADYLRMAASLSADYGINIAIEPLCPTECNIINTVLDALVLARLVNLPNVGVLADWYHMAMQNEGVAGVLNAEKLLLHCHIANPAGRRFPLADDGADFSPLFGALARIGYNGRVSVEGSGEDAQFAESCNRLKGSV
jgi:D-psicose/D-tagatose/L-ribulose 3-epimerase